MISERIRGLREEKRISQAELAERAGLSLDFLAKIEGGEAVPDVETLERIATALEVPLHNLFYEGDEAPDLPNLPDRKTANDVVDGKARKDRK